jgi:hypothetical protein
MSRLDTMTDADVARLRDALRRLAIAADSYAADADGVKLLAAMEEAWEVLDDGR